MTLTQSKAAAQRNPPVDHLMDAPLADLLTEYSVDVSTLETDPGFTGGAYVRADGTLLFVRPAGQPEAEWEMIARSMLGRVLRVPLPELPSLYELTEL
ncbi:hypothetical protein [Streptomyces cyanogenus]|uniref:Uncharacterized protein n=1 Tax=Streptomyces cyanogenus TaxID=80860 RepID=A0ABX7TK11_STRCY|nr:hypothetical protein [Streptomyces cyanogenus]QTD97007.1 hypothetical protein S1361_06560 [Streptomyces cyanogenus]